MHVVVPGSGKSSALLSWDGLGGTNVHCSLLFTFSYHRLFPSLTSRVPVVQVFMSGSAESSAALDWDDLGGTKVDNSGMQQAARSNLLVLMAGAEWSKCVCKPSHSGVWGGWEFTDPAVGMQQAAHASLLVLMAGAEWSRRVCDRVQIRMEGGVAPFSMSLWAVNITVCAD